MRASVEVRIVAEVAAWDEAQRIAAGLRAEAYEHGHAVIAAAVAPRHVWIESHGLLGDVRQVRP